MLSSRGSLSKANNPPLDDLLPSREGMLDYTTGRPDSHVPGTLHDSQGPSGIVTGGMEKDRR